MSAAPSAAVPPARTPAGAAPKAPPASPEQLETVHRLVQIIVRLFYDDGQILVVDQLIGTNVVPSDVLARRLGLQTRDLAALAAKLVEDRIVSIYRSQDTRDGVLNRAFAKVYYYIDYKEFLDVVKWRMMAMRRTIDTRLRNGLDNKGYLCPRCKKSYSTLEVAHLLDFERNIFVCDVPGCGTELIDNEDAEDVRQSKDTLTRFNEQLSVVQQALRSVEGVALPPLDVREWLAKHAPVQPWLSEAPGAAPVMPSEATQKGPPRPKVHVELAGANPGAEELRAREKAAEEEKQRAQNTLPAWHLASTISGDPVRRTETKPPIDAPAEAPAAAEETRAEDVDYYAQYTAQAEDGAKRSADTDAGADAKRTRTDASDDDMDDMEDVI